MDAARIVTAAVAPRDGLSLGVDADEARKLLHAMLLVRQIDTRAFQLNRQGKIPFALGSEGHEAVQAGAGLALVPGKDELAPYYRDTGLCLALGMTTLEIFRSQFARATDISGGRQFPSHWTGRRYGILSISSILAAHLPHAVGAAYAMRARGADGVVLASFGEGATSEGEWHESMNFASVHRLPVIMLCQNNGWAISTPQRLQMAVGNVADRAAGYGMPSVVIDGMDPVAVYEAMREARKVVAAGNGPVLVEAKCRRVRAHSTDDDDRGYRPREEVEESKAADPIPRFSELLIRSGVIDAAGIETMRREILADVNRCTDQAESEPLPEPHELYLHVHAGAYEPWQ